MNDTKRNADGTFSIRSFIAGIGIGLSAGWLLMTFAVAPATEMSPWVIPLFGAALAAFPLWLLGQRKPKA